MALPISQSNKKPNNQKIPKNPQEVKEYIQALETQLQEEHEEKEALSLERAKLKVCWEMTLEELASTRIELTEKIKTLENDVQKQMKKKKFLQNLINEYGKTVEEMKGVIDNMLLGRPKCNIKY